MVVPVTMRMPSFPNASSTRRLAKGSSLGMRRSPDTTTVTSSAPRVRHACAISTPTGPPPSTSRLCGTSLAAVALRLSHGSASWRPSMGGMAAVLPVARTTATRALSVRTAPSLLSTSTRRSPASRPRPRMRSTFTDSSHCTWPESS